MYIRVYIYIFLCAEFIESYELLMKMNQQASLSGFKGDFECVKCGRRYKHKFSLNFHLKYECGVDRQFQCIECHKCFVRNSHLKVHMINVHKKLLPRQNEIFKDN